MKIAVTYENGKVYQHFGHTKQFKLYNIEKNEIIFSEINDTSGSGHSALANLLADSGTNVVICGGIGSGAKQALEQVGIQLYGGVQGDADQAIESFLSGNLAYNPNVQCNHHAQHHGEHSCSNHGCKDDACH